MYDLSTECVETRKLKTENDSVKTQSVRELFTLDLG
jgi:hypothetical protein